MPEASSRSPAPAPGSPSTGDARAVALADYDRDGRVDVAFGVNGAATRLFRNVGAAPGLRVVLEGPRSNPRAVGARLRLEYADGTLGPVREIRSGEGYLARHESTQTLGVAGARGATLHVVWPDGEESSVPIAPGTAEVRVGSAGAGESRGSSSGRRSRS